MNQLPVDSSVQLHATVNTTKHFNLFGALLIWLGLLPITLTLVFKNPHLHLIGLFLYAAFCFIFFRCYALGLLTVEVIKKPRNDNDWILHITPYVLTFLMIGYFLFIGSNSKVFAIYYAFIAAITTLKATTHLNVYQPGELS